MDIVMVIHSNSFSSYFTLHIHMFTFVIKIQGTSVK